MAAVDGFDIPQIILRHFDLTTSPYTDDIAKDITSRRRQYPENKLFFDQLLAIANVDGDALYPPRKPAAARRLLHAIVTSPVDRLKRDCFIYYLLKDQDAANDDSSGEADGMEGRHDDTSATVFAKLRCLPVAWTRFMDGYWNLDHGQWADAVKALSNPAISEVNFIPQILLTLATAVSPPSSALTLIDSFLCTVNPTLASEQEIEIQLVALAHTRSMSLAFAFIRDRPAEDRVQLREVVWCWMLGAPRSPCGAGRHDVRTTALRELLHLPLLPDESAHLIHFLSHPPKSIPIEAISLLHDLVTLRLVHQGQYAECLQLEKDLAGTVGRPEDRQRRRDMIRQFISILPRAQRRVLHMESEMVAMEKDLARREMTNGFQPANDEIATTLTIDMDDFEDEFIPPAVLPSPAFIPPIAAPSPIRPKSMISNGDRPASPRPASPFAGPPRFAHSLPPGSPVLAPRRVPSGSPFQLPARQSSISSVRIPPPRQIVNDDDDVPARRTRAKSRPPESPPPLLEESIPETSPLIRRSSRIPSASHAPPQSPPPADATPKRRGTRQLAAMPGTFSPEDALADLPPPSEPSRLTRSTSLRQVSETPAKRPSRKSRRSLTAEVEPEPKRSRRGERTPKVAPPSSVRRSTRRAGTAGMSEAGSPTPSVATRKGRQVTQTPRATRSRK